MITREYKVTFAKNDQLPDEWHVLVFERPINEGPEPGPWRCINRAAVTHRPWLQHSRKDLRDALRRLL